MWVTEVSQGHTIPHSYSRPQGLDTSFFSFHNTVKKAEKIAPNNENVGIVAEGEDYLAYLALFKQLL